MPLQHLPDVRKYLRRTRIELDSDERNTNISNNLYSCTFDLPPGQRNVNSIELIAFNFDRRILPTFTGTSVNQNAAGNNLLDVYLETYPTPTNTLRFTSTLRVGSYSSATAMAVDVEGALNRDMDAQGDAYFTTTNNVEWTVTIEPAAPGSSDGYLRAEIRDNNAPDTIAATFLFGTGDNRASAPCKQFGFPEGVDAGGVTTLTLRNGATITKIYPLPSFPVSLAPCKYLDVYVREFPEFQPLARVFFQAGLDYTRSQAIVSSRWDARTRLVHAPPRRLNNLTIDLVPQGGFAFEDVILSNAKYTLTFDLLELSPEECVPEWAQQVWLADE